MSDILINTHTNDFDLVDGDLAIINSSEEAIRQEVVLSVKTYRGEWFLDTGFGMPWIANENNQISVLNKLPKDVLGSYLREVILSLDEALSILNYQSNFNVKDGVISLQTSLETPTGPITINENIDI